MNGLESSKIPSPDISSKSKVKSTTEPENTGKLKGSVVSKRPDSRVAKKIALLTNNQKLMETRESVKKERVVLQEKSQHFKALSEQFESSQQGVAKPWQEVRKLPEDKEGFFKASIIDKKLDFFYQSAQSTHDKSALDSIKKDIERLEKDLQGHEKLSTTTLLEKCKHILEEIHEMGKALKTLEIVKKGKSMQGYPGEVLSYEGYQILEEIKEKQTKKDKPLSSAESALIKASDANKTSKAIKSIKKKLQEAQLGLIKQTSFAELKEIAVTIKAGTATNDQVKFIVDCKRLWLDLMNEEGSYLEILNFIGKKDFEGLDIIKEATFIQGPQVDMMLNQAVLDDHLKNKPSRDPPMRFLIEGAGPNGLYAALQFFRNGASVSVVNDRDERVIRNQNMILDPKWIAQLNFLLGSKFNELFIDPKAVGVLNLQRGSGTIKTRILEDVMKVRATEISSYIEDTKSFKKETFLNLHFETPLKGIQSSDKGFSAIIGVKKKSADTERFQQLTIESLTKKILSTKYARHQPEDIIDNQTVLKGAQQEAAIQWKEEQAKAKIEQPVINFDFLACVGGANDSIRDEFLEPAVPLTSPKNYGIASWIKPETQSKIRYFTPDKLKDLDVKLDQLGYPYLTRQHVEKSLQSQELDQFLAPFSFPEQFKKKYENFTEKLLKNIEVTHLPDVEFDQPICGFNIRMFENHSTAFLASSTPPLLSDFLHDLSHLIASAHPPDDQLLKNLKKEIDKKWMNALAGVFGIDPNVVKLDEEYAINIGTFDVQQKGIDTAAKLLKSGESSAVIAAFGDSRASPHFFSGSGMSSGRLSIDNGAEILRKFNREEILSKKAFVKRLDIELDQAKEKAIDKGRRFVKPNDSSERIAARCLILKNKIKDYFDNHQKTQFDIAKTGWKIETEANEKGEFDLNFIDKEGKQHALKIKINQADGKLHAKGKKYLVFNDLLLELGFA